MQQPFPPPPFGGLIPLSGHLDYLSRYTDPTNDPYQQQYDGLMTVFAVPPQGQATPPALLLSQIADSTAAGVPAAFLMMVEDPFNPAILGQVMCFHRVTKYTAKLGHPSPWDNYHFAFAGNNSGSQVTTVIWRSEFLAQANQGALIRVPTEQQADIEAALLPLPPHLGPYQNNDAGTETIRTRRSMVVPPAYIRLFLTQPLSPMVAYQRLRAATIADGTEAALLPLSMWLRAACTISAAGAAPHVQGPGPYPPFADSFLHTFTWTALTHDLPLVDPGYQINSGLNTVAGNLGTMVTEQRLARQEAALARNAASAPKTIESLFRTRMEKLLRLCRASDPADLPPVYSDLANCRQKDLTQTMQDAIHLASEDLRLGQHFVITPALAKKIINVSWAMVSMDDIDTGIHHFHVVQQSPEGMAAARHLVATYDLIHTDGTSLSLADAERLATIQSTSFPLTWIQARHTIGNLIVLCHVFLGATHPLTTALASHFNTMVSREVHLETLAPPAASQVPRYLLPCYYTRWHQIRFSRWFARQTVSPTPVPAPDFDQLLNDIEDRLNWIPDFPSHYLPTATPSAAPAALPPAPVPVPAPLGANLPPPAPPPANPAAPSRRVDNPTYNETLFGRFRAMPGCTLPILRQLWANASPPVQLPSTVDNSRRRCLAYHVKGMCNTVCRNSADHTTSTPADDQALVAFCTQHWHT
jgi:hypothetical protein